MWGPESFINHFLHYSYMIYNRQKLLLQVIKFLSERDISSKTYLVKAIFLLRQKLGFEKIGYNFYPYRFGPFSNAIYEDFSTLETKGLFDENELHLTEKGFSFVETLKENKNVFFELDEIVSSFPNLAMMKKVVYDKYPEFTIKSSSPKMLRPPGKGICSIGYESKTIDSFLNELIQHNVSLLIDVRKNAFSMKKEFCKANLEKYLGKVGIGYLHFSELGIDSSKRKDLNSLGAYKQLFKAYRKTLPMKKGGIDELKELAKMQRIALMCFEADKNFCHRGILSDFLDCRVDHI